MNSFEINKILGALLGTCLVLLVVHIASGAIFTRPAPAKPGYEIAVKDEQPGKAGEPKAAAQPIETLLASASVDHGAQVAKQCQICHNLQEGLGPKVGPDLYGVVGRPVASLAGFHYSDALKALGGTWTFEALNKWLDDPRADVPGTAMTFAGLKNEKQRADVIAYLNTLSKNPRPLPTAQSQPAPAEGAAPEAKPAPAGK
jgi:cytochrome c